jgi:hypothetical protein
MNLWVPEIQIRSRESAGARAAPREDAGTLFALLAADIRVSDLRPFERRIVDLPAAALLKEGLPTDALGRLESSEIRLAKTASKHALGVMNQMALEIGGTSTKPAASRIPTSTGSAAT